MDQFRSDVQQLIFSLRDALKACYKEIIYKIERKTKRKKKKKEEENKKRMEIKKHQ